MCSSDLIVNLAPADKRKEGSAFDLAILISILINSGELANPDMAKESCFIGELSLSGDIRRVNGVLCMALASKRAGKKKIFVPYENAKEVDLKNFLRNSASGNKIAIIVGSEGGFKQEEADKIVSTGATSVSLGSRIMRAETASVAVLSAVMYEKDEWRIK